MAERRRKTRRRKPRKIPVLTVLKNNAIVNNIFIILDDDKKKNEQHTILIFDSIFHQIKVVEEVSGSFEQKGVSAVTLTTESRIMNYGNTFLLDEEAIPVTKFLWIQYLMEKKKLGRSLGQNCRSLNETRLIIPFQDWVMSFGSLCALLSALFELKCCCFPLKWLSLTLWDVNHKGMKQQFRIFRTTLEASLTLDWIEEFMENTVVDSCATPPASPQRVGLFLVPTAITLNCALQYRRKENAGQLFLLGHDLTLKIKSMAKFAM
ncbi:hypothetical protein VNO77_12873 [Canavalia gladiata]|uniref:Uncharacterized protein n=1 Tax=Canavalia gladiata TaxID=3824 RepID=A0AAN9LXV7_CANGL